MTDDLRGRLNARPTSELVEILREQDPEEWRSEVFPLVESILLERGVDTAAIKAAGPRPHDTVEFGALECIGSRRSALEAQLCQMALAQAGIEAWLSTEVLSSVAPHLGLAIGVDILVRPDDAEAARDVLAEVESGGAAIPAESEICPACSAADAEPLRTPSRLSAIVGWALAGSPLPAVEWRWKCKLCGHEWV